MENSRFYREMVNAMKERECSIRQLAIECGVNYLTFVQFFNPNTPFKPVSTKTKFRIHNHLGISYEIMENYNEQILAERGE